MSKHRIHIKLSDGENKAVMGVAKKLNIRPEQFVKQSVIFSIKELIRRSNEEASQLQSAEILEENSNAITDTASETSENK